MGIENGKKKIEFLEKILKIAKENSEFIVDEGVEIFDADSYHVQERCSIGIKIDDKGIPYFTIHGTYVQNKNRITKPEILLVAGERYLPSNLDQFKQQFHLYKDYTKQSFKADLINTIRIN